MESVLHWADYLVLASFLVISLGIGVYHSLTGGKQKTTTEFIMANRALGVIPTSLSMMVSFQSAIMVLGMTAEMYLYGVQYMLMIQFTVILSCFVSAMICVPWIYPLRLVSVYEYFELRFHSKILRAISGMLGITTQILYMGISMYAPSAALEAVTGFSLSVSIPVMAIVSVTYTALGGMRAVIWTDVFQFGVMFAGMLAILIKGLFLVGGIENTLELCGQEDRLNLANFSPDPRERHTVWGFLFGLSTMWIFVYGVNQSATQRYCATTSLNKARSTVILNIPSLCLLNIISCSIGLVVTAYYAGLSCDPLKSRQIENANQLLPLFVTTVFAENYGFAGLFLATLYGGSLSSISSSLSGCAANCWEDVLKCKLNYLSENTKALITRLSVIVFGVTATGIAFLPAMIPGPVTQITLSFYSSVNGPLAGLFALGGTTRFANWKGSLVGVIVGIIINCWLSIGSLTLTKKHPPLHPLPVSACASNFANFTDISLSTLETTPYYTAEAFLSTSSASDLASRTHLESFYSVSYVWLTLLGALITFIVGALASLAFGGPDRNRRIDERYLIQWSKMFSLCPIPSVEKDLHSQPLSNSVETVTRKSSMSELAASELNLELANQNSRL